MFSFVDQIHDLDERRARGRFAVPAHFGGAPPWLIAEAVGQLAGWIAMAASDFRNRAVAALVGSLIYPEERAYGGVLELAVEVERRDRRAILYRGEVRDARGVCAELRRCLGPLLPMEDLDDPRHARGLYERLRGAAPLSLWSAADPLPILALEDVRERGGGVCSATVRVPLWAPFFADHFPRRPVLPATLLVQAMCDLGTRAAAALMERSTEQMRLNEVRDIKVRSFTAPGETLLIESSPCGSGDASRGVRLTASNGERRVATVTAFAQCRRA